MSRDEELAAEYAKANAEGPAPDIIVDFDRVLCAMHGEPFRVDWPKGFDIAARMLFGEACKTTALAQATGGDRSKLGAELDRRPACCWLEPKTLKQIYLTAGIGFKARCKRCGKFALGTEFRVANQVVHEHLCLWCVARSRSRSS